MIIGLNPRHTNLGSMITGLNPRHTNLSTMIIGLNPDTLTLGWGLITGITCNITARNGNRDYHCAKSEVFH